MKKDYSNTKGQAFHFDKNGNLSVVDIKLKPYDEVERLMMCEKNNESYKQELTIQDNQLIKLADLEDYIKSLDEKIKEAKVKQEELKNALMDEMEQRGLKSFEKDNIKLTYVAPSQRTSVKVDDKTLKEKYPAIYDELATTKTTDVSRSLRITIKE